MKIDTGKRFIYKLVVFIMLCLIGCMANVQMAEAALRDNPYVTFSPDQNAFTTNADEKNTKWYEDGYTVYTGKKSSLRTPAKGEHLYAVIRTDTVPIGKWSVAHEKGQCVHVRMIDVPNFHGVMFEKSICLKNYYSGWQGYCADCGQKVVSSLFYMSDKAAKSLTELDMSLGYYYRCPHCTHLEQGVELKHHICQDISPNQYSVRYHANYGSGYMPKSMHMYDNATVYEGSEITPQKNLTLNNYTRVGYEFQGWNTERDGSGDSFGDGEEILNLCAQDQESIILYAQWKRSESVLEIDPNGGMYQGSEKVCRIQGLYGSSYKLLGESLRPPIGGIVRFDANGGEAIADMPIEMFFSEWSFDMPMQGVIEEDVYTFKGANGVKDSVRAVYGYHSIRLPECVREGYSFGGWYRSLSDETPVGFTGDEFIATQDVVLYAKWVNLQLESRINMTSNGGKGAVDLSWNQRDSLEKSYKLYQKEEGGEWEQIHSADDISAEKKLHYKFGYTGREESFVIPYSGSYRITLTGAQGADYEKFSGGKGGMIEANIYFEAGDILKYIIGGQDGYNGGGGATHYGNGGGYSVLATDEGDVLLIAGGGGGATSVSDGHAGGSRQGIISGRNGQDGMAGGGGGHQGGSSGSALYHYHTTSCSHVHIGTSTEKGGCYTEDVVCGNTEFTKTKYKDTFYYGNRDDDGNHIYCVRCGSYECPGHRDIAYRYTCTVCGTYYNKKKPAACTANSFGLGCGLKEGYNCGYEEGEVLGAEAAFGGSNYVDWNACRTYEEKAGEQVGDGQLLIDALHIGFIDRNELSAVVATDHEPPQRVVEESVVLKPVDENKVNVVFGRPKDRGTTYYHKVESYDKRTMQKISTSNQTVDELISGVVGYRYRIDDNEHTGDADLNRYMASTDELPYIGVVLKTTTQYLHMAAVDKAGNCSEVTHIPLSGQNLIFWPIITEPISVQENASVFQKGDVYYIKADGTTSFKVSFCSRLCGTALADYQINQVGFFVMRETAERERGQLRMQFPMEVHVGAGLKTYRNETIQKQYAGTFLITDTSFTEVRRSNYCKDVELVQSFSIPRELDGECLMLTPKAAVETSGISVYSEESSDLENSVFIMADGSGPRIEGLDGLQDIIALSDGDWKYDLEVFARDDGSGLKSFALEIWNQDNGGYERIEDIDGDGKILLSLSSEYTVFLGDFVIMATAIDNVGNESVELCGLEGVNIHAYVENPLNEDIIFKNGETGKLHIDALGYIDRIEVLFPKAWTEKNPALNKKYYYEETSFTKKETLNFMVPLGIPQGEYRIIVRGYKGEKLVEARPDLLTIKVSGSVLDEIRTRLR